MTKKTFWEIIKTTYSTDLIEYKKNLSLELGILSVEDCLSFAKFMDKFAQELNTYKLWAVADLYYFGKFNHKCNDAAFGDWRTWIVLCGEQTFRTALHSPDDLLDTIIAHPNPCLLYTSPSPRDQA